MKRKIFAGSTGIIEDIFVQDTSSTTGAGLSGLTHNTANLVAYYKRKGAAPVAFTLVAGTQGQHINSGAAGTGGGFVAIPNLSGGYEVSIPDAAVAAGARSVLIWLQGATNMAVTPLEIELDALNYQDPVRLGQTALPNVAAGANGGLPLGDAQGRASVGSIGNNVITPASILDGALTDTKFVTAPLTTAGIKNALEIAGGSLDTLLARLSALRAGYLDKLNIAGNVAASSEVTAIQNNTSTRFVVPDFFERPDSGSTGFVIDLYIYDEAGNMEVPDSVPTIAVLNEAGVSRSANLSAVSLVDPGHYRATYTLASNAATEQLRFEATIIEGGATRLAGATAFVVDTSAVDFTASDRTTMANILGYVDELEGRLTNARALLLDNLSDVTTGAQLITARNTITAAIGNPQQANSPVTLPAGVATSDSQAAILAAIATRMAAGTVALSPTERDALAASFFDLLNGVENGLTLRQAMRLISAVLLGKEGTNTFRDVNDTKDRVTYAITSGKRTSVARDAS